MVHFQAQPEGLGPLFRLTALSLVYLEQPNRPRSAWLDEKGSSNSDTNETSTDPRLVTGKMT